MSLVANRYRITRLIGKGGMGEVFAARDTTLDAEIALKTMRPELEHSSAALERFRREIGFARRVTDPHVCRVYDVGEHDRRVFLVLVYMLAGRVEQAKALRAQIGDKAGTWMSAIMDDALGNLDAALANIEGTVASHNLHATYIMIERFTPQLRAHPRYQALVKLVGLS